MALEPLRLVSLPVFPEEFLAFLLFLFSFGAARADLVTYPYIQEVDSAQAVVRWVSHEAEPVPVRWLDREASSQVTPTTALNYHPLELAEFSSLSNRPRYLHSVTLDGIEDEERIEYLIDFPDQPYRNSFAALPSSQDRVRLIAYADSETEPESTGKPADWGTPLEPRRRYLIDQTAGYQANLETIRGRKPNAVLIAGDLVESGGEQRDWDEFWRHKKSIAGAIRFLTAPGNHEYYAGPRHGAYGTEASRVAIAKYRTYFPEPYYSRELGRVTVISLDSNDGLPHKSKADSNHHLEAAGDFAPSFHPESEQYRWLEKELAGAQKKGQFILVMFHHCPYSSGIHGFPAGEGAGRDPQSGQPLRGLTPLLLRYGVDLLITGHDEMMERSTIAGEELTPDGRSRPTTLRIYDVGIGGDGLRGPRRENEFQEFLADTHSPEEWNDGILRSGGRHYGHLEIEVTPTEGGWTATLTPVYILPVPNDGGWEFQRKEYPDRVNLKS